MLRIMSKLWLHVVGILVVAVMACIIFDAARNDSGSILLIGFVVITGLALVVAFGETKEERYK